MNMPPSGSTNRWTRAVWKNPPVGGAALLVLLRLADRADAAGRCYPGANSLAADTRMTVRSVRNALTALQQLGVLKVECRGGGATSNRYCLALSVEATREPDSPVNDVTQERSSRVPCTTFTGPVKETTVPGELRSPKHPKNTQRTPKEPVDEVFVLPQWIDPEAWNAFESARKARKKPIPTNHACRLLVKQLEKLEREGSDPKCVLEQSIMHGWPGLYPVRRDDRSPVAVNPVSALSKLERNLHAV